MPRLTPGLAPKSSPFTIRYFMASRGLGPGQDFRAPLPLLAAQRVAQDLRHDFPSVEICLRKASGRPAMALVVLIDHVERLRRLRRGGETKHAFAVRKELARAGILDHDRFAARQVAYAAVTDPRALKLDI